MSATSIGSKIIYFISLCYCSFQLNAQETLFSFSSSSSSIGQGQTIFATPTNGWHWHVPTAGNPYNAQFLIVSNSATWSIVFNAGNAYLSVGSYPNAVRAGGNGLNPGLAITGNGHADSTLTGAFTVLEVSYSAHNALLSLAADFIQYDEGNSNAWIQGSIRVNSTIPLAKPVLYASELDNNSLQVIASNCPAFQLITFQSTTNFINWNNIMTNDVVLPSGMITNTIVETNSIKFYRAFIQ